MIFIVPAGERAPLKFAIIKGKREGYSIVAQEDYEYYLHSTLIKQIISHEEYWEVRTQSGSVYMLYRSREDPSVLNNPYFPYTENLSSMEEACQEL